MLCSGRPATEHFTNRVFGLPSHLFFPHHTALLQGLRAQLTPAHLPHHAHGLLLGLETHAQAVLGSSSKVKLQASGVWQVKLWGMAFTVRWHQSPVRWLTQCSLDGRLIFSGNLLCCPVLCCEWQKRPSLCFHILPLYLLSTSYFAAALSTAERFVQPCC